MITETEFLGYIEALCKRPKMYTSTGSFNEVTAFLEGYGAGARVGSGSYHSVFTPFHKWIVVKLKIPKEIINWDEFRDLFSSETEALKQLPVLYKEFAESNLEQI